MITAQIAPWGVRIWLAVLLGLASEVIFWTNPSARPASDWAPLAVGYLALSTILLDLTIRYQVRGFFGVLLLSGLYGLLAALLVNPETILADAPRTVGTRALGIHTLAALLIIGLLLGVTRLRATWRGPLLLAGGALTGLVWGFWARRFPVEVYDVAGEVALETLLGYGIGGLLLAAVMLAIVLRFARHIAPERLRTAEPEWALVIITSAVLLGFHIERGEVEETDVAIVAGLAALCGLVLWSNAQERARSFLHGTFPLQLHEPQWVAGLAVAFIVAGGVGYSIPLTVAGFDLLDALSTVVTVFGQGWLPLVSAFIGLQTFARMVQSGDV